MSTKEIIKRFQLENGWDHNKSIEFMKELGGSLKDLLEQMRVKDNINKFNECIKQIRSKFDGISNKIPYGIPETVWNTFYKVQIIPLKEEFCPEISKKLKEEYEAEKFVERKKLRKEKNLKSLKN